MNLKHSTIILFLSALLSGCLDSLPNLLVYDEIGMPEGSYGIYDVVPSHKGAQYNYHRVHISYGEGKYSLTHVMKRIDEDGHDAGLISSGRFVPSKVDRTKDLYIMSFPSLKVKGYRYNTIDKKYDTSDFSQKNSFFVFKFEDDKLLIWFDLIENSREKNKSEDFKSLVSSMYARTLTQDPSVILHRSQKIDKASLNENKKKYEEVENRLNKILNNN